MITMAAWRLSPILLTLRLLWHVLALIGVDVPVQVSVSLVVSAASVPIFVSPRTLLKNPGPKLIDTSSPVTASFPPLLDGTLRLDVILRMCLYFLRGTC